ncbi:MAG: Smr/MutS family protein, partial [Oscillospiraceae bacterium]|nr:Smr/MutS family protein [Oscillospiraceae bacterium]
AFLKAELEVRLEKADLRSRREAERILAEARETAEEVFRELDEMRKRANDEDNVQRINEARSELRRKLNRSEEALRRDEEPVPEQHSSRPVKPGDTVQIKSMGMKAEVISVSADRVLSLRAGIMNVTAREDEVLLLEGVESQTRRSVSERSAAQLRSLTIEPQIDLRGMEAAEAVLAAERYLDSAVMAKLHTVTIIHGKGTGALRTAIQQMLRRNKAVKSFRLGRYGEGETGVTVVELK